MPKVENVCVRVRDVPGQCQIRQDGRVLVFPDQRTEHDLAKPFGTGIYPDTRIQVGRRLVERDGDHVGIRGRAPLAACQREKEPQKAQKAQKSAGILLCFLCLLRLYLSFGHPGNYTVTARDSLSTVDLRSLSI